jgi:hypothetical protein
MTPYIEQKSHLMSSPTVPNSNQLSRKAIWSIFAIAIMAMTGIVAGSITGFNYLASQNQAAELEQEANQQLQEARQLADSNQWFTAIDVLKKISPQTAISFEAKQLQKQWFYEILRLSQERFQHAKKSTECLETLPWLEAIPTSHPTYAEAQKLIQEIRSEPALQNNQTQAQKALKARQWKKAIELVEPLRNSNSAEWQKRGRWIIGEANAGAAKEAKPIDVRGVITDRSSLRVADKTFFDRYQFEGKQGQRVSITMESEEFDTRVFLNDADSKQLIAASDDGFREGKDSTIRSFRLPHTGTYEVLANAYSASGRGKYRLVVETVPTP